MKTWLAVLALAGVAVAKPADMIKLQLLARTAAIVVLLVAAGVSGDFAYGVNVPETGDVKAHRQITTPNGQTEGEYRWLQPNGLYRVTRYFVDGDNGYQAVVSEEPGQPVNNFYTNSYHRFPGMFIPSQINSNTESGNINQGFTIPSSSSRQDLINLNTQKQLQNRPYVFETNNNVHSDVVIVGENEKLPSNRATLSKKVKRASPLYYQPFNRYGGHSLSESFSHANPYGSGSSQSGSLATSNGFRSPSRSGSFSGSSYGGFGSTSHSGSYGQSGNTYPHFLFRKKRSPEAGPFDAYPYNQASFGVPGLPYGSNSFGGTSAGGFGNNFGTQGFSRASSGQPGLNFGSDSFSGASTGGGFGNKFGAQSVSGSSAGLPGFGFESNSFSEAAADGFGNNYGAQSFSIGSGAPGYGFASDSFSRASTHGNNFGKK